MTTTAKDGFSWETLLRDESELVRRAAVPGGWLVSHVLRTDPPVSSALTFVPDADAAWRQAPSAAKTTGATAGVGQSDTTEGSGTTTKEAFQQAARDVVSTGAAGIVTTQAELDCLEVVRGMLAQARPDATLGFIDTPTYFALHLGSPSRWFARLCLTPRNSWIALHLAPEALEGFGNVTLERLEGNWASAVRFSLPRAEDLRILEPLLLKAVDLHS